MCPVSCQRVCGVWPYDHLFPPNFLVYVALHIKAEVMRWVYTSGTTKKPKLLPTPTKQIKSPGGFWGGLSAFLNSGANTPQRVPTPLPAEPDVGVDSLSVTDTQVTLSVFSADVNVQLSTQMNAELHRSTKKNPPSKLKYELIYVSTFHEMRSELMKKMLNADSERSI